MNATDVSKSIFAKRMMVIDHLVFGHSNFDIVDTSLFLGGPAVPQFNNPSTYFVKQVSLQTTDSYEEEICIETCDTYWCAVCHGADPNCPLGQWWSMQICSTQCYLFENGGGSGGGTGGGSGGGGGSTPIPYYYPCPTAPFSGSTSNIVDPCSAPPPPPGTGWQPVPDEPPINLPLSNSYIIDSLGGYPCAQQILSQIPLLNSSIAQAIQSTFGLSPNVNLTFTVDSALIGTNVNGYAMHPQLTNGVFTAKVKLNPWVLNNSTREYILQVMLHESLHSYIDYYYYLFQTNVVDSNFFREHFRIFYDIRRNGNYSLTEMAQHEQMTENYLTQIENSIRAYNQNITPLVSRKLAWEGLQGTSMWYTAYPGDTTLIMAMNYIARDTSRFTASNLNYSSYNLTRCP